MRGHGKARSVILSMAMVAATDRRKSNASRNDQSG